MSDYHRFTARSIIVSSKLNSPRCAIVHVSFAQLASLAERQAEAERLASDTRLHLPRLNAAIDSHAIAIHALEAELKTVEQSQQANGGAIIDATTSAAAATGICDRRIVPS